ncbi:unnamed protein product [Camellia sinensis]
MFYAFYLIQIPDAENWLDLQFGQTVFSCALYQMLRCGGSYIYGSCFYRWCHLQQTKYLRNSHVVAIVMPQFVMYIILGPFGMLPSSLMKGF